MRPGSAGSAAKRARHTRSSITTTGPAPGWSSRSVNVRPSSGCMRSTSKNRPVDPGAGDLVGVARASQVVVVDRKGGHAGERPVALAPGHVIRRRDLDPCRAAHGAEVGPDEHQPIRLRKRQRTKEDGAHDAENGGVGADAQGEHRHRDGGEPGRRSEGSQCEPHVPNGTFPPRPRHRECSLPHAGADHIAPLTSVPDWTVSGGKPLARAGN